MLHISVVPFFFLLDFLHSSDPQNLHKHMLERLSTLGDTLLNIVYFELHHVWQRDTQ